MKRISKYLFLTLSTVLLFAMCNRFEEVKRVQNTIIQKNYSTQLHFLGQWLNVGKREKLIRDFVREFEFKNQHIEVLMKFPEEVYFDRSEKYSNERFIAKEVRKVNPEWDIIRLDDQFESVANILQDSLWSKKYLVDLSTYPEFINNTRPELLSEKERERCGGIFPGPYLEGQYWALWSNKKLADKIGIQIKQYGMSVDDFISYIEAVDHYNKNNPNDYIVPLNESFDRQTTFHLVFHMYASLLTNPNEIFSSQITNEKKKAYKKTLEALEKLSEFDLFDPNWKSVSWSASRFDLINERCLFYCNGSWMYNYWIDKDEASTQHCFPNELPVFKDFDHYPGGYIVMWAVLKNSPNKEAAIDFLLAMNNSDLAELWVQYTKCPTGILGKLTDVSFGADQFETFSANIQRKYGERTYKAKEGVNTELISGEFALNSIFYREVLSGYLTAEEAYGLIY